MKRMNATLPLTLPEDLIIEILMRLPVRSILRFKSVCKSWLSLISDPEFTRSHFVLDATPTDRLLSVNHDQVDSTDIEASLDDNSAKVVFNFPLPSSDDKYGCRVDIVGSCRGFILLITDGVFDFIIWNPSTGLRKGISYVMDDGHAYDFDADRCGFGYDSSTDDYVIVNLVNLITSERLCTEAHCFSLKTNSWSRICILRTVLYYQFGHRHGALLNGALHWLVGPCTYVRYGVVIVSFDVTEKRLSEIPLPHHVTIECDIFDLRVMGGCLCLCVDERGYGTAIWTMKEYKVQSSWTKLFVPNPMCHLRYPFIPPFYPICLTKKDEFLGSDYTTFMKVNDKGELLEHHASCHNMGSSTLLRCGVYRESLLSLPEL